MHFTLTDRCFSQAQTPLSSLQQPQHILFLRHQFRQVLYPSTAVILQRFPRQTAVPLTNRIDQFRVFQRGLRGTLPTRQQGQSSTLRRAVRQRQIVRIAYTREDGTPSSRELWPLGLFFWGRHWTLIGWCLLRGEFRHFRVDRIGRLDVQPERYPDQPGRRLNDFFDELEAREGIRIRRR